jgi:hypothetical protein
MLSMDTYSDPDRHARARDKKREKREQDRRMRGNRSVFEIQKAVVKRAKKAREGN